MISRNIFTVRVNLLFFFTVWKHKYWPVQLLNDLCWKPQLMVTILCWIVCLQLIEFVLRANDSAPLSTRPRCPLMQCNEILFLGSKNQEKFELELILQHGNYFWTMKISVCHRHEKLAAEKQTWIVTVSKIWKKFTQILMENLNFGKNTINRRSRIMIKAAEERQNKCQETWYLNWFKYDLLLISNEISSNHR